MTKDSLPHESAVKHVTGESVYIDDIPLDGRTLTGRVVYSPHAYAKILSIDISRALSLPGVYTVLTSKDISGVNQMGPVIKDEVCLCESEVNFAGQAICLIAAEDEEVCIEAEKLIGIEYEVLPAVLTIQKAQKYNQNLGKAQRMSRGDVRTALKSSPHVISGQLSTGAQEHWYLETQACLCLPGEQNEYFVYSSTQHPSETQALVAEVLGVSRNEVVVEVRRIGGAFGGKETQANHTACWTALLSQATGVPVKIRLFRDDDQKMTGKRHPFLINYKVGFDERGLLTAGQFELNSDGGAAMDLSHAIMERALFHIDNAYYIPHIKVTGRIWKTNLPPNTAMRGFGGPQAMAAIENILDHIARFLHKDAALIRKRNFYGIKNRNVTHYGQKIEHNHLHILYDRLYKSSDYKNRRAEVNEFNSKHEFMKRGLALTPVKFGISFTTTFLNQAGALVNIYQDGSVLVNHGGTEMGQGLNTKIKQIAAEALGINTEQIKVNATNTSKVPNTSATAASSGTDLNGMAVMDAIIKLKQRIAASVLANSSYAQTSLKAPPVQIQFRNNKVYFNKNSGKSISFEEAVKQAYLNQTSLSATGYYRTPRIGWDKNAGKGRPFNYYAFGMAASEIELDILTGYHRILRTDILHDAGDSINPQIDIGQIQGGFIQGVGWCTTEECKWDDQGNLLNHSPDTYKIPGIADIPVDFRVNILKDRPNPNAIRKSKATGEPPLMLCFSVWLAIKDAISAVGDHQTEPGFFLPATNEKILFAIEDLKSRI